MTDAVIWNGKWHPLAERFPMLAEDDLRALALSIATSRQYVPCVMGPDGLGYDGRNRVAACAIADVAPAWTLYDGDPVAFIVEINAERRHLTTGQRAMAVAIGLAEAGQRRNGKFVRGSKQGDTGGSSRSAWVKALGEAGLVLDHAPDLADLVLAGALPLDAAYGDADQARRRKERLADLGDELLALVDAGVIDLDEAERRADEERRTDALDEDLAERVRAGTLAVDEAETLVAERRERVAAWAEKVKVALRTLAGMAGYPVPAELAELLTATEQEALAAALGVIPQGGLDD